ncbi:SHOCT domain-containing protein [Escherichia coli]
MADELTKLAGLKERGIITEDEFRQMKQDLIKKKTN